MIKVYRIISIVLLVFTGIEALYGGILLIIDPTGRKLQLPQGMLENTPFHDYLIPGIILTVAIGIFSFITLLIMMMKRNKYPQIIVIQGLLLAGWITVQVIMLQTIASLHLLYWSVGVILMICGGMLFIHEKHQNTTII